MEQESENVELTAKRVDKSYILFDIVTDTLSSKNSF